MHAVATAHQIIFVSLLLQVIRKSAKLVDVTGLLLRPPETTMYIRNAAPSSQTSGWTFDWPSATAVSIICRGAILAILILGFLTHRIVV